MSSKKREREGQYPKLDKSKKPKKSHENTPSKAALTKELRFKSALVNDEVDFPRGGGSLLTPFEYKEAQLEAAKEVADELNFEVPIFLFKLSRLLLTYHGFKGCAGQEGQVQIERKER